MENGEKLENSLILDGKNNLEVLNTFENGEKMFSPDILYEYFFENGYNLCKPKPIKNSEADTIFITAGIQSLIQDYRLGEFRDSSPVFIAQPVIRTQFIDSISEGSSISFVNISTACFNVDASTHDNLVSDWMNFFHSLGMDLGLISTREKNYSRNWGNMLVAGKKTFYSYNGMEIGDSALLYTDNDPEIKSLCDVGFGLERIRWILREGTSYFDVDSGSVAGLNEEEKAFCSSMALMAKDGLLPSNKDAGYRFRQFSKRFINEFGYDVNFDIQEYTKKCLEYWSKWSTNAISNDLAGKIIFNENERNGNRKILDVIQSSCDASFGSIDINLPRHEFLKRLDYLNK